jgi:hypothetical protein
MKRQGELVGAFPENIVLALPQDLSCPGFLHDRKKSQKYLHPSSLSASWKPRHSTLGHKPQNGELVDLVRSSPSSYFQVKATTTKNFIEVGAQFGYHCLLAHLHEKTGRVGWSASWKNCSHTTSKSFLSWIFTWQEKIPKIFASIIFERFLKIFFSNQVSLMYTVRFWIFMLDYRASKSTDAVLYVWRQFTTRFQNNENSDPNPTQTL